MLGQERVLVYLIFACWEVELTPLQINHDFTKGPGKAYVCIDAVASCINRCECGGGHCAQVLQSYFVEDGRDVEERQDDIVQLFSGFLPNVKNATPPHYELGVGCK